MVRDREKQQKALRRANMTEEERKIQQEKDKERKRIKANSIKEEMKLDDRSSKTNSVCNNYNLKYKLFSVIHCFFFTDRHLDRQRDRKS